MNNNNNPKINPNKPMHPDTLPGEPKPSFPRQIPKRREVPSRAPVEVPPTKPIEVPIKESNNPKEKPPKA